MSNFSTISVFFCICIFAVPPVRLMMPALVRSFSPLLRTSKLAFRPRRGVNPVQQVFSQDRNGIRGLATVFERNKPHVNIGTSHYNIGGSTVKGARYYWTCRPRQGMLIKLYVKIICLYRKDHFDCCDH